MLSLSNLQNEDLHHCNNEKKGFQTPQSKTPKQDYEHVKLYSPDAPFICSQLGGTQECEVVWDCNTPGHSKDDLKRSE